MTEKKPLPLMETGIASAFTGWLMLQYAPNEFLPAAGLIMLGVVCWADHFRHKSNFDKLWKNLKLCGGEAYPIIKRTTPKEGYTLYEFTLPAGLSVDDFIKKQAAIEQYVGHPVQLDYGFKNILLKVFDGEEQMIYHYQPEKLKGGVPVLLGYDRQGIPVSADLSNGEPHMYIAGETGSGKSTALRSIIVNLILLSDVELFLGDLKNGVEFNMFRNCKSVRGFARSEHEMLDMLKTVQDEVERRYNLFSDTGVEDIAHYNKGPQKLKYWLVVIDEFSTLMYEKDSMQIVESLAAKSRACGIHLLLSTQRPDAKVITGRIKANVSNVLGLKTLDGTNSQIIIGHPGLEKLRGHGHGIFRRGAEETVIQAPLLTVEDAKKLIAPYIIRKPQKKVNAFDCLEELS